MTILRPSIAIGFAFAALLLPARACGQESEADPGLVIATGTADGAYHSIGEVLKLGFERGRNRALGVLETSGSIENIALLRDGAADFALIQSALHVGMEDLTALANVGHQHVHVLVRVNSDLRTFTDLAGKRVSVGPEDGGTSALGNLVFNFYGFEPQSEIVNTPWESIEQDLDSGEIDAAFLVFRLFAPYVDNLLRSGKYRLIPIHEADALSRYIPGVERDVIPSHAYGPNRGAPARDSGGAETITVDTLLIARPGISSRDVRALLRTLYSIEVIKLAGLSELTEASGQDIIDLPLHPAADRYYRRDDPITSDMFEIASFFLAGLITLVSVAHYLLGRHQKRTVEQRRRRIVPYFENLLDIGGKVEKAGDPGTLVELINEMMATQRQAEREWLDGKLDTEHMENLYSIYNIRTRNAFNKIFQIQNAGLKGKFDELAPVVAELAKRNNIELPAGLRDTD